MRSRRLEVVQVAAPAQARRVGEELAPYSQEDGGPLGDRESPERGHLRPEREHLPRLDLAVIHLVETAEPLEPRQREQIGADADPELVRAGQAGTVPGEAEHRAHRLRRSPRDRKVTDPVYKAALEKFGERGIMDIIGIIGYYDLVSMTLITMQAGAPNDSVPPLPVLAK